MGDIASIMLVFIGLAVVYTYARVAPRL